MSEADSPTVVLVDAFSTGALLARQARQHYRLIHVRSRANLSATFAASLPAELFDADLSYADQADDVLHRLAELAPVAVIAASEFGVEVADEIAAKLALRGNDPALSYVRRDKFHMVEAVAAAGLRTARQRRGTDAAALLDWRREAGLGRTVVKPLDSAGSDDVFISDSEAEIRAAVHAIIGKTNLMLRTNAAVLAQEYLVGDEYIVNSVSRDGRHWFTDAWISHKVTVRDNRRIYDYEDLLSPADPRCTEILDYVSGVLDALGIANGPAHTELIYTAAGPVLLETGARISGLANPPALDRCTGVNQVGLTMDCYLGEGRALAAQPPVYTRHEHARCVNLIAHRELPLPAQLLRAELEQLPAIESIRFRIADQATTRPTVDLNSSPGVVFLVHQDPAEIDRSYLKLRRLEHDLL
ncbi:ATP-grasp domain-containing protein [Nocardia sp. CS682]|uniref:ATP-grasp domain-containing protein n=1 Tax=Nocardia sp. CS682 TaxID=1047172 RepID=UPI0010752208|nr:ATP-grasp domain-containing protein [Nocardia sp. CS682]QBS39290.1 biotin carboxylase [Nocardia sp. CS682]